MAAPKGNNYWQLVENPGRPRKYQPDELWQKAIEYFQWCDENPWKEAVLVQRIEKIVSLPKARPYTEGGFKLFANISNETWANYCSGSNEYKDFLEISHAIKETIRTQKFEGAAAGFFNANIIARDLGLRDASDHNHSGAIQFSVPSGKSSGKSDPIE